MPSQPSMSDTRPPLAILQESCVTEANRDTTPCGYLPSETIRSIFDAEIPSSFLEPVVPRDNPGADLLLGQPGAGKSTFATGGRSPWYRQRSRICTDDYKLLHPQFEELVRECPEEVGRLVREVIRAWHRMSEEYVRSRRGDVLIEMAPGSPDEFLRTARDFHDAGYTVRVLLLAVRSADSLQGAALRHARFYGMGAPAQITSRECHDLCHKALADIAEGIEGEDCVDAIVVKRRDGEVVHKAARTEAGAWDRLGCAAVVKSEHLRLYSPAEAARFLRNQDLLRDTVPHRGQEIAEIDRRAAPFLPFTA
ncbi:zeta toxin family protein [Streptomyces sp. NPDC059874]|uniref:zeta toxin family protein n=1 Tax=Streptomyces sp. NPDC059874 TaxID=3346983 RepID=UPI0036680877